MQLSAQPYGFSIRGIKHILTSWLVRAVAFCARHSFWPVVHWMGDLLGSIVVKLASRRRTMAHENVRLALSGPLSDEDIDRIVRRSAQNIVTTMLELFKTPAVSREEFREMISADELQRIEAGLDRGNGVLLLTAHYGNWEYLGIRASLDYETVGVARDPAHAVTADLLNSARCAFGGRMVQRDDVRGMLTALRENNVLFMLADQHWAEGGVRVKLLGRPVMAPQGPAHLALRTGCMVLPAFCIRGEDNSLHIRVCPEIEIADTGDTDADVVENTQRIYDVYSTMIRQHPEQWLWLHRRWRNLEPEEEKPETVSE